MKKAVLFMILIGMIGLVGCGSEAKPEATTQSQTIPESQKLIEDAISETPFINEIVTDCFCGEYQGKVSSSITINDINGYAMTCDFLVNFLKEHFPQDEYTHDATVIYEVDDDFLSWHTTDLQNGFLHSDGGEDVSGVTIEDMYNFENSDSEEENEEDEPEATIGEQNALDKALSYLEFMAFSKKGLKKQLEYEGFEKSEIKYAIKHCGADWKEQAVKKAEEYLNSQSFSKQGLYDQLIYEGFTEEQAEYGVEKVYK